MVGKPRQDDDEIIELYARGLSVDETAALAACSNQHVRNVLARNAFPTHRRAGALEYEQVDWTEVIEDYEGVDMKVTDICKKHGIWPHDLYKFLALRPDVARRVARGFIWHPPRGDGRQLMTLEKKPMVLPDPAKDEAVKAYVDGWLVRDILLTYRLSRLVLYRELALRKIALRKSQ